MDNLRNSSPHQDRLDSFNQDCLDLFKNLSVEALIPRIMYIAATWTNGSYCIFGFSSSKRGYFSDYQVYGLTPAEAEMLGTGKKDAVYMIPSQTIVRTLNMQECRKYRVFNTEGRLRTPAVNSILHVPIFSDERQIGSITLLNKIGAEHFSEEDAALAESLAVYSGIAINNARLYFQSAAREKMLTKQNDALGLLNELSAIFARNTGDSHSLMDEMLTQVIGCLGFATAELFLNSEEKPEEYTLFLSKGHEGKGSLLGLETITCGEGLLGECAEKDETYCLNADQLKVVNRRNALRVHLNYMIILPIPSAGGALGLMLFGGRFAQNEEKPDKTLLSSIAGWVAPVIESLRMTRQKQRIAILEERERIGMDLHDGVIQSIYGVGLMLENARVTAEKNPAKTADSIKAANEALNATIKDIRSYIMNLKPAQLTHENIVQSLRRLANDFHANTLVNTRFVDKVEHVEGLSADRVNVFYMICKEALSNIAKHAHAKNVTVNFTETEDRFVLLVQDDGDGFDTTKERKATSHGVTNMYTRTRNLGGDMDISSIPGSGTMVIVWLPWSKAEKSA